MGGDRGCDGEERRKEAVGGREDVGKKGERVWWSGLVLEERVYEVSEELRMLVNIDEWQQ